MMRAELGALVGAIDPWDATERDHRRDVLDWIRSGAPLHRIAKPATPPKHLVSYSLVVDPVEHEALLIDHRLSGLWLPAGGHVEEGEDPAGAAVRELREELAVEGSFLGPWGGVPFFVTVRPTVGQSVSHVDVSLWYAFAGTRTATVCADEREAADARWWPFGQIEHDPGARFDPHLPRAVAKLSASIRPRAADSKP